MGEVINLEDYKYPWKEVLTLDSDASTLQVYFNEYTNQAEIVQMNDDGDTIRNVLNQEDAVLLSAALVQKAKKAK